MNSNHNRGDSRKKKQMRTWTRRVTMGTLIAESLTFGVNGAESLPYGHKDFVPTPEKPIYFRAGNGEYPGATPPMEWWEGTPTTKKVGGIYGNPPKRTEANVPDFADAKSKNILWKAPVPGWSLSHPIVVGNPSTGSRLRGDASARQAGQAKVFAVGEPDFVTCWDLDTGKQLWQRRMMPLLLDGLPEEKAVAGQKVLDLARALFFVLGGMGSPANLPQGKGIPDKPDELVTFVAKKRELAHKYLDLINAHRSEVEAFGDADVLAALDKDIGCLHKIEQAADWTAMAPLITKGDGSWILNLKSACLRKLGVPIGGAWWGYVGTADSTLASDGQRIYGVFDQGQVFCLDLDGRLLWGHREKVGPYDNRGAFHRSPLLCNGLLLVRNQRHAGKTIRPIRAYDAVTGQVRWEAPVVGSNYTIPRLMRLPGPDGKPMDVLIGDAPEDKAKDLGLPILRVSDGKVIGHTPYHDCGRGAVMGIHGDIVVWTSGSDTGGGPSCCYRLKADGADAVSAEKIYVLGEDNKAARIFYNQHGFPTMLGSTWVYGNALFDVTSGRKLSTGGRYNDYNGMVIAGRYLIAPSDETAPWGRKRDDHKAMRTTVVVDLGDPANPKAVARNNLLGYADPPTDIIVSTYFKDFDPYQFAGSGHGTASYFSMMGGPVPHGNRILIQSTAFLYCIGEK